MVSVILVTTFSLPAIATAQSGGSTHVGDVLGDLIHIKRDTTTGQPILQERWILLPADVYGWGYCPIPIDAAGLEIPFLPDSCDPDPAYADALIEVDYFGRLSGGRTQERNQRMHLDEVIVNIKAADQVGLDDAGRIRIGTDCTGPGVCDSWRTIDSPMENLSLYRWVMKYGHLQTNPLEVDTSPGGDPAAGTVYHPALDETDWAKFSAPLTALLPRASSSECFPGGGFDATCALPTALTAEDFVIAGAFLAGAADKTGRITVDLVQYLNRILKITEDTAGSLATLNTLPALIRDESGEIAPAPPGLEWPASERFVDYSPASYLRSDWFSRSVLVLQSADGFTFQPTSVDLMTWLNFINGPMTMPAASLAAFIAGASDALRVVEFMHEYEIPADLWASPIATMTTLPPVTVGYSAADQNVTLTASVTSSTSAEVDSGIVTFVVRTSAVVDVGVPVAVPVIAGVAGGTFVLPGGTAPQVLDVTATFAPGEGFAASQGVGTLTIVPAATVTTVASAYVPAVSTPEVVTLSATVVANPLDTVNEGTLLFSLRDSTSALVGTPVPVTVTGGAVSAPYTVPGGLPAQRLTIVAEYQGTALYAASSGTNLLAVGCLPITILPVTLPAATLGQPYSQTLSADGIPPSTFSLGTVLPAGLDLAGAVLSGVPTVVGTFWVTIEVVDATGCTGSRTFQFEVSASAALVTGSGIGMPAHVRLLDATGAPPAGYAGPTDLYPFPGLTAGVRVAQGDVTGDDVADTIVGAGPGGGPQVMVYDGMTGAVAHSFWAFDYYSGGGTFVATGDVNGDGTGDIAVSQGHGVPRIRVFSGTDLSLLRDLTVPELGPFGARIALGDVDLDGRADLILGAGPNATPAIRIISGATSGLLHHAVIFAAGVTGGVFVAAGDVDGNGVVDVVAGVGGGSAPVVRVLNGATFAELRVFTAFDASFTGGVRVASRDLNGDGFAEIIAGAGPGMSARVVVFDGQTGVELASFLPYAATATGGVHVASGR